MKRRPFMKVSLFFLAIFLLLYSTATNASVDEWQIDYFLSLEIETAAIAFDGQDNLYIQPLSEDWESSTKRILKYEAPAYENWIEYASFVTSHDGVSGLDFDAKGDLFVGEFMDDESAVDRDSGLIRKISAHSLKVSDPIFFPVYRPTGIAATGLGILYFPARKWTDIAWGNVFKIESFKRFDPDYDPMFVGEEVVLTAIAVDISQNLYSGDFDSIKTRNPHTGDLATVAGFETYVEELAFDSEGNLYALMGDHRTIHRITPPYISIDGCDTGMIDWPLPDGSKISEMIESCEDMASNHGMFVNCVINGMIGLRRDGFISNKQMPAIVSCAARANIP